MMEIQSSYQRLDINRLTCCCGNKAKFFCSNSTCQNSALLCSKQHCDCSQKYHSKCGFTVPVTIAPKVQQKRKELPSEIDAAIKKLGNIYTEAIQKLSNDRDQLMIWKEKFGLNVNQAHLINLLQSDNTNEIKGSLIYKIKKQMDKQQFFQGLDQQWVQNIWRKKKFQFQKIFDKLAIFKYQQLKLFKFGDFEFDQKCKPVNSTISEEGKVISLIGNGNGQRIAYLTPNFSETNAKYNIQIWAIHIKRYASWVGLGICHYNQIKNLNFQFLNYSQLGHGNYIISMNSYSWSSSNADQNNKNNSFSFTTGDTINICYDSDAKKLKFWKNQHQKHVLTNVQQPPKDDFFVPCINMNGNGDCLQLVEPNTKIQWDSL